MIYKSLTQMSAEISKNVFGECAFWSILAHLKWVLISDLTDNYDDEFLKNLIEKNEDVAFVYYHKDEKSKFVLLGVRRDVESNTIAQNFCGSPLYGWTNILNALNTVKFENFDFNQSTLIWDVSYQQCVGTFIDCMNGGCVDGLPLKWDVCYNASRIAHEESVINLIDKNCDLFSKWCKENPDIVNKYPKSELFYKEFVDFFEKGRRKQPY